MSTFMAALAVMEPCSRPPSFSRILEKTILSAMANLMFVRKSDFPWAASSLFFFADVTPMSKRAFARPPSSLIFVVMPS